MEDLPEIRIGTAEREEAMQRLSDHFAAGRLTVAEFDDRSGSIAAAVYRGDLAKVFLDLPEPATTAVTAAKPAEPTKSDDGSRTDWPERLIAVIPIIALILFFVTHTWLWFLLIPLAGALFVNKRRGE
ncbi:DUF1707 SHOCT-like domain-containing protein [Nocardia callitridis]|uniref:DUF1707 domain-containing protein n=1 Tax=Nocardia callitridis TaxID=648753 RepID=A0ABP9KY87_9NOCA